MSLLDTYNEERHPVLAEMLRQVIGLYNKFNDKTNPSAGLMRGKEMLMLFINYRWSSILLDQRDPQFTMEHPREELVAHSYGGWEGIVHAGDRAPDASGLLDTNGVQKTLFDLFHPAKHTILVFGSPFLRENASSSSGWPVETVQTVLITKGDDNGSTSLVDVDHTVVDNDGHAHRTYLDGTTSGKVVIVRPDGIIGAIISDGSGCKHYFAKIFL